jgi:hypothetical protein
MAFGCSKPAVVLEGIHAHDSLSARGVPVLIERAHRMLDADG